MAPSAPRWGDRLLFAALGALVGFAGAWIALEGRHAPTPPAAAMAADPHAGVPGAPPLGPNAGAPAGGGSAFDHWQSLYNEVVVLALDKHEHDAADAALARLKKEHPGLPAIETLEKQIGAAHGGS